MNNQTVRLNVKIKNKIKKINKHAQKCLDYLDNLD